MHTQSEVAVAEAIRQLTSGMANLPLFVAIRSTLREDLITATLLLEHLRWMTEQEAQGRIFASGPFEADGMPRGAAGGLTIVRAANESIARELIDADPFIRSGAVGYDLRKWLLMEGSFDVHVRLSAQPRVLG